MRRRQSPPLAQHQAMASGRVSSCSAAARRCSYRSVSDLIRVFTDVLLFAAVFGAVAAFVVAWLRDTAGGAGCYLHGGLLPADIPRPAVRLARMGRPPVYV